MKRAVFGWVALLLAGTAAASSHIVDLQWREGRFSHEASVPAGKFVEVCGALSSGEVVDWSFDGAGATDFNIHYHVGKDTSYPVKQDAVSKASGRFEAPKRETYCWMWTNRGSASVGLTIRLQQVR